MFSVGLPLLLFQGGYVHNLAFSLLALFYEPSHDPSHISELSVEIDFSRCIILIWKIQKACPRCYWATSGSRKLSQFLLPVALWPIQQLWSLCSELHKGGFAVPAFNITIKITCSHLRSGQGRFFSAITRGKTRIQTQQSLVCKESHVLLGAVTHRITLNAQVSLLARLAVSLHSLHSFLFTGIYTVYSKYIKEK